MTERPRQPAGSNHGGQFGAVARAESDLMLRPVPKGSFLYPPFLHDAAEAIAFWESTDIPDAVLDNIAGLYQSQWAATVDYGPEGYWVSEERYWEAANPAPTDRCALADWEALRLGVWRTTSRPTTRVHQQRPVHWGAR